MITNFEREIYDFIIKSSEGKIDENTNINSDLVSLGFDSISFVKLIVKLEEQFGFEFETERLLIHAFTSVMSMIEYIKLNVFWWVMHCNCQVAPCLLDCIYTKNDCKIT